MFAAAPMRQIMSRNQSRLAAVAMLTGAGVLAAALTGCGSGSGVKAPTIAAAKIFKLEGFEPAAAVSPGRPTTVAFTIEQPDGKPLTRYKTGPGPHTGVHLIIVRDDLSVIIHRHPRVGPDGEVRQPVTFPAPGPYRVLIDAYPNLPGSQNGQVQPNFQLTENVKVSGAYKPRPLGRPEPRASADGYVFTMAKEPRLKAVDPALVDVTVKSADGKPATFTPWYGALAHAIFFRAGSLDYFHTHVCGASAPNCASSFGGARVTGTSTQTGKLSLGILLPVAGTWRLFLQTKVDGRVVTAPFTLKVA